MAAAETLGIRDLAGLDPGLASIIVGAPLVAATSITVGDNRSQVTPAAPSDLDADEVR